MRICIALFIALAITTGLFSCHKETPDYTPYYGPIPISENAYGAFYAIRTYLQRWDSSAIVESGNAEAWFGNPNRTELVDSLSVNGTAMTDSLAGSTIQPQTYTQNLVNLSGTIVTWSITGNSMINTSSFVKKDTATFPTIDWPSIPLYVSAKNLPTFYFKPLTNNIMQFICTVTDMTNGSYSGIILDGNTTSLSLARMYGISVSQGDLLRIDLTPYEYTSQFLADQNYCFVKASTYTKYTYAN